ncbi:alpha/beta hydrolase [Halobacteriales archaeon QH_10_67_22]|nr:MAG: alpha/beta hydrolase [Halobacteriales archaeon QH_10_67_22]
MPVVTNRGRDLYYELAGDAAGFPDDADEAPDTRTVAFVNPVGFGAWVWSWQHGALTGPFEALVWDLPGTGRSDAPDGPLDVAGLAADFEAVLADAGVAKTHVVGAGLGSMVAVEYAREYGRAETLALFGTAADGAAVDRDTLASLFAPRDDPDRLRASLANAFEADPDAHREVLDRIVDWRAEEDADRTGFDAQAAAMTAYDADALYGVTTPARVFHGEADAVVPASAGRDLSEDLPRGEFTAVEGGHLCFVEESAAVTDALLGVFDGDG